MSNLINILNIGHDIGLLEKSLSEAQQRQLIYCKELPAHITHIVRANQATASLVINLENELDIHPCPSKNLIHFAIKSFKIGFQLLKNKKFDLIQVQEPYLTGIVGLILSKIMNVPLIVGIFSDEINNPEWIKQRRLHGIANAIGKFVLRHSSAVRTDSQSVKNRLSNLNCKNLTYIPFLITNAETFLKPSENIQGIRKQFLLEEDAFIFLAVNRLESEKNISMMLKAMALASPHIGNFKLLIAGTGKLESALKAQAEKLIPGKVHWLGWVSNHEIASYYQAADLVLISSNRESAARILYESLLSGTPVISTSTAGANEVIDHGITGLITPIGNAQLFCESIIKLSKDKNLPKKMGDAGQHKMKNAVTSRSVISNLRNLYTEVLLSK